MTNHHYKRDRRIIYADIGLSNDCDSLFPVSDQFSGRRYVGSFPHHYLLSQLLLLIFHFQAAIVILFGSEDMVIEWLQC